MCVRVCGDGCLGDGFVREVTALQSDGKHVGKRLT